MQTILVYVLLTGLVATLVAWIHFASHDDGLALLLIGIAVAHLAIGAFNSLHGPIPGAEVDAVVYEGLAWDFASYFQQSGKLTVRIGREGYATLLSLLYIVSGRSMLLITLLNTCLVVHALTLVYRLVSSLASRRQARLAVLLVGCYPTSLLYTSVPMRESALFWALMVFVYGLAQWADRSAGLVNWRVMLGLVVGVWLHGGFVVLAFLPAFLWWYRAAQAGLTFQAVMRTGVVLVVLSTLVAAVFQFGGLIPKFPADPTQLLDADFLGQTRAYKASYGTGYLGFAPSGFLGLLTFVPISVLMFLTVPLPGIAGAFEARDAFKYVDSGLSLLTLVLAVSTALSLRNASVQVRRHALLLGVVWALLVVVFALGTANVGIAIRHRSKFMWLLILTVVIWHPFFKRWGSQRSREGEPARSGV